MTKLLGEVLCLTINTIGGKYKRRKNKKLPQLLVFHSMWKLQLGSTCRFFKDWMLLWDCSRPEWITVIIFPGFSVCSSFSHHRFLRHRLRILVRWFLVIIAFYSINQDIVFSAFVVIIASYGIDRDIGF